MSILFINLQRKFQARFFFIFLQATGERKGTFKVEYLQKIEEEVQKKWEDDKVCFGNILDY